jgi:regulator of sigma E protease
VSAIVSFLFTLVAFAFVLAIVTLSHEAGHFFTARLFGVKVNEFGLGYPPRLFAKKGKGGTEYSINLLPLGGFVKLAGEEDPNVENSLASKSHAKRITVLAAGAIVNAVLPIVLFTFAFALPHDVTTGTIQVLAVSPGSPAEAAGIVVGDVILSFNGRQLANNAELGRDIFLDLGETVPMQIQKADGTVVTVTVTPRWNPPSGQGAVGVETQTANAVTTSVHDGLFTSISSGIRETGETMVLFKNSILSLIFGAPAQLSGPVGIAQMTGEVARAGFGPLLEFTAFLSLNLAILNILPIPALDGGRIAFVVVEWARRGKRIDPKTEGKIHFIGFVLLIGLILLVTFQDIVRIVGGG